MTQSNGLPTHIAPKSRSSIWKQDNKDRYNDYQRDYMQKRRAKARAMKEELTAQGNAQ